MSAKGEEGCHEGLQVWRQPSPLQGSTQYGNPACGVARLTPLPPRRRGQAPPNRAVRFCLHEQQAYACRPMRSATGMPRSSEICRSKEVKEAMGQVGGGYHGVVAKNKGEAGRGSAASSSLPLTPPPAASSGPQRLPRHPPAQPRPGPSPIHPTRPRYPPA